MVTLDAEVILAALGKRGLAAAVVRDGTVVAANPEAAALGDVVALAGLGARASLLRAGERIFEVQAVPVGELTVVLGRDVTEREELRRQLARSDEILRTGAHELRNPLHVIGMICHLLENRAARGEALDKSTVERLRRQMDRLDRLISQLLDLVRVQEGRLLLDLEEADLLALAREQIALVDPRRAADLKGELEAAGSRAMVRADLGRIGEVLHQLIENAVRFTEPGTPIFVRLAEEGANFALSVEDRGPGIPEEDQALLFQRHVRIDRRRGPQGLGLGLYIAAYVASLHGGSLGHEPVSPSGARFVLRLRRLVDGESPPA